MEKIFFLAGFLLLFSIFVSATDVDSCRTIDSSGYYVLTTSISSNNLYSPCIVIDADDVFLDCNGYSVNGFLSSEALVVSNQDNVTIQNCVFTSLYNTVDVSGSNIVFRNNYLYYSEGFYLAFFHDINGLIFFNNVLSFFDVISASDVLHLANVVNANFSWNTFVHSTNMEYFGGDAFEGNYVFNSVFHDNVFYNAMCYDDSVKLINSRNVSFFKNDIARGTGWCNLQNLNRNAVYLYNVSLIDFDSNLFNFDFSGLDPDNYNNIHAFSIDSSNSIRVFNSSFYFDKNAFCDDYCASQVIITSNDLPSYDIVFQGNYFDNSDEWFSEWGVGFKPHTAVVVQKTNYPVNATFLDNVFESNYVSLASLGANVVAVNNSFLECSGYCNDYTYDVALKENGNITLLNCSYNPSKVLFGDSVNNLLVGWFLKANVTDSSNNPLQANVSVKHSDGSESPDSPVLTGLDGLSSWLKYWEFKANGTFSYSNPCVSQENVSCLLPLFISVNKTGYASNNSFSPNDVNYSFVQKIVLGSGIPALEVNFLNKEFQLFDLGGVEQKFLVVNYSSNRDLTSFAFTNLSGYSNISFTNSSLKINLSSVSFPIHSFLKICSNGDCVLTEFNFTYSTTGFYVDYGIPSYRLFQYLFINSTFQQLNTTSPINVSWSHAVLVNGSNTTARSGFEQNLFTNINRKTNYVGEWIQLSESSVGLTALGNNTRLLRAYSDYGFQDINFSVELGSLSEVKMWECKGSYAWCDYSNASRWVERTDFNSYANGSTYFLVDFSEVWIAFTGEFKEGLKLITAFSSNSNPFRRTYITIHSLWTDDAYDLDGYIISVNFSETWENYSFVSFDSGLREAWVNYSLYTGNYVGVYAWRVYVRDANGNWLATEPQVLNVGLNPNEAGGSGGGWYWEATPSPSPSGLLLGITGGVVSRQFELGTLENLWTELTSAKKIELGEFDGKKLNVYPNLLFFSAIVFGLTWFFSDRLRLSRNWKSFFAVVSVLSALLFLISLLNYPFIELV